MIYKTHYYCAHCKEEILSSHAYRYNNKLYCGKECIYSMLDIDFVRLEKE